MAESEVPATEVPPTEVDSAEESPPDVADDGDVVWEEAVYVDLDAPPEPEADTEDPGEADAETEADDADGEQDDAEVTEEPDAEEAEAPEEPEAEKDSPEPEYQPFSFRVDGKTFEVEGAVVMKMDDGTETIVMPRQAWERTRHGLADRTVLAQKERDFQTELKKLDPAKNETVIKAQTVLAKLDEILESPEALEAFVDNFDANKDALKLKAENAALNAKLNDKSEVDSHEAEEARVQEFQKQVSDDLPTTAKTLLPQGLTEDQQQWVLQRVFERADRFYFVAREDQEGLTPGQLYRRDEDLKREVSTLAQPFLMTRQREEKAAAAEKKNKAALGQKKKPPVTPPAKGTPAPTATTEVPEFKSAEDWKKWVGVV